MSLIEVVVSMLILAVVALGATATITLVNSEGQRTAGGGSVDLQALSLARETLDQLKNAVSVNETLTTDHGYMLVDTDATAAGGTKYIAVDDGSGARVNPSLALPPAGESDIAKHNGNRSYTVWDIDADGDGITDYKKVVVVVDTGTA